MTDWADRLIGEGAARAAELLGEEVTLGRLQWHIGGRRCYSRRDGAGSTLTVVGGDRVEYVAELVGVDDGALT